MIALYCQSKGLSGCYQAPVMLDLAVVPTFGATGAAVVMLVIRTFALVLFTRRMNKASLISTPRPGRHCQ